ncbi:MAG: hypothetical protein CL908_23620 [Deltaproteobacteria bacterium]|nr:hypothetical protein [Deltaproteobacteria bacterium]
MADPNGSDPGFAGPLSQCGFDVILFPCSSRAPSMILGWGIAAVVDPGGATPGSDRSPREIQRVGSGCLAYSPRIDEGAPENRHD